MKHYSQEYLDILYRLDEVGIENLTGVPKEELQPYIHLQGEQLIIYGYIDTDIGRILRAELSPHGKDYLSSLESEDKRFNKTHFVAVLALVISILSLLIDIIEITH